jgi:ankyrin repeat protein
MCMHKTQRNAHHYMVASYGHVATARLLVKMGGDATEQDVDGSTPLHDAAAGGHAEIVMLFVDELGGGVLATHGVCDGTSLHWAANHGNMETVRMLVEMGSNLHARAVDGCTPLH